MRRFFCVTKEGFPLLASNMSLFKSINRQSLCKHYANESICISLKNKYLKELKMFKI